MELILLQNQLLPYSFFQYSHRVPFLPVSSSSNACRLKQNPSVWSAPENGVTKKKTLCQIAAELEKVDTNILGVVQNMVGSKKDSSYYGKGNYGYYYGNNQNKK